ncbi:tetratricopeptide repeat protein [Roseateles koreensis]|uniref:Tetratricopeptide repeat protein n=1 Tax=Roseateles koreensis TaxID=2987526 RepID=A0ABT5KT95_9BURK|nr:hypothetical protein [Roseateles koreensis]MDC8786046.1 hypothetical protein [Roseateles koreensis]
MVARALLLLWSVLSLVLLGGCAGVPAESAAPVSKRFFHDELFKPLDQPVSAEQVFALSPAMQHYLAVEIAPQLRDKGRRKGLLDALYLKSELQLEYDASYTRNAAEAFAAKRGNCLSLVIMTAALAQQLNIPLRYQSVYVDEFWTRSGGAYVLSGHVNVSLGKRLSDYRQILGEPDVLTVDFLPPEDRRFQRTQLLGEQTIVAMYMNNRAAENLLDGRQDTAYWWAREALVQDPKMLSAYNTLAVIYRRSGHSAEAEWPLRHVLSQEPANLQALSNLSLILSDLGQVAESEQMAARVKELQPYPPYRYFDLGILAMHAADFKAAKSYFEQEIARSAYVAEFHFWAALANFGLGDVAAAREQMALALENSNSPKEKATYSAKLNWLNAQRVRVH